jgi:hypothetical protein
MTTAEEQSVTIAVDDTVHVSGLLLCPSRQKACFVFAHGAGAGMTHPFMTAIAMGLTERNIGSLRYQFPYMERKSRRPDPPKLAQATVRAAVNDAARLVPDIPLFAGGKSFGGRMTSQAPAAEPLPGVRGLVFLGFPLHPAGKPSRERAKHLLEVKLPMLFLQGTRDALAEPELIKSVCADLGNRASLKLFPNADHSFHVPARSGTSDPQVREEMLDVTAAWINGVLDDAQKKPRSANADKLK